MRFDPFLFYVLRAACLLNVKLGHIRILKICLDKSFQNMVKRVHLLDHISRKVSFNLIAILMGGTLGAE